MSKTKTDSGSCHQWSRARGKLRRCLDLIKHQGGGGGPGNKGEGRTQTSTEVPVTQEQGGQIRVMGTPARPPHRWKSKADSASAGTEKKNSGLDQATMAKPYQPGSGMVTPHKSYMPKPCRRYQVPTVPKDKFQPTQLKRSWATTAKEQRTSRQS